MVLEELQAVPPAFKYDPHGHLYHTSLWFELPGVTDEAVRALFGEGLESQNEDKYSTSMVIASTATKKRYVLYKSYGQWRVGWAGGNHEDKPALLAMFGITN